MAAGQLTTVIHHLRGLARHHATVAVSDGELLGQFVCHRDETAFTELLRRHGPMVLGVCRRVLRNEDDAEDAFQATFLVLVKRAASVRPAERVGNWLYGVAYRTALEARGAAARRQAGEAKATTPLREPMGDEWAELRSLLDRELSRLPEKYRVPIVLCDLEGKTRKEAAHQLGWADGTVASRLARGRDLLARRLTSPGTPVTVGAIMTTLAADAAAGVPDALSNATIRAVTLVAAGTAVTAGVVPAKVAALVEGVTRTMLLTKLNVSTALLAALVLAVAGLGGATQPSAAVGESATRAPQDAPKAAVADKEPDDEGEPINAIWVTDPRVRKELRLTEAQVKKVAAVRSAVYRKHEAELKKGREEAKKHDYARSREITRKVQAEERAALEREVPKILSESAVKRLRQIQRQARGLHNVIRQPAVRKRLKLDDEQAKQIEGLLKTGLDQARKEAGKAHTGPILAPMTIEDHIVQEQQAYTDAMKSVVGVLTPEQRRIWIDLVGEPFAFKASAAK
jgi:RNA polymerase sigma factor (sigma-70 family)